MIGINKGPIALNLETQLIRATIGVQPRALGKGAIVAVVVVNTLNNMDSTNNATEIMVGNATGQPYQMLPGQESPLIYASDLDDVYARVRTGVVEVDVTVIIYKEKRVI